MGGPWLCDGASMSGAESSCGEGLNRKSHLICTGSKTERIPRGQVEARRFERRLWPSTGEVVEACTRARKVEWAPSAQFAVSFPFAGSVPCPRSLPLSLLCLPSSSLSLSFSPTRKGGYLSLPFPESLTPLSRSFPPQ